MDAVHTRFGRIDVLANTVGGYRAGTPVHETPVDLWDAMLTLNARSAFLLSRAVVPAMLIQLSLIHIFSFHSTAFLYATVSRNATGLLAGLRGSVYHCWVIQTIVLIRECGSNRLDLAQKKGPTWVRV